MANRIPPPPPPPPSPRSRRHEGKRLFVESRPPSLTPRDRARLRLLVGNWSESATPASRASDASLTTPLIAGFVPVQDPHVVLTDNGHPSSRYRAALRRRPDGSLI